MYRFFKVWVVSFVVLINILNSAIGFTAPTEKEVLAAMRKASEFMAEEFSYRGGYCAIATSDLSEWWNEASARRTQIFIQGGTPPMGRTFIEMYKATGDVYYLKCAEKAANALVYGQHPLGGWHYFIDFDMTDIREFYRNVLSQFIGGMEEYRHFYGNCTFDDNVTQGATQFLLDLYMTTFDPKYREPLLKALDFIMMAQYPNGAWPQRYPLRHEFAHDGLPDYTSLYTLNDGLARHNIDVLINAYEQLGNEKYLEAAKRGADFIILAQLPEPQAAWADQYDMNIKPAWGRTHEPPAFLSRQTVNCVYTLMKMFRVTGDHRYLQPIPATIKWLKDSTIKIMDDGTHGLARFYDVGTNLKVNYVFTDRRNAEGYWIVELRDPITLKEEHIWTHIDVKGIEHEYNRLKSMSSEEAVSEYRAQKAAKPEVKKIDPQKFDDLIASMDKRGAWIEEMSVYNVGHTMSTIPEERRRTIQGISTETFMTNMNIFMNYLKTLKMDIK